ncbi:hypothetical protein LWI29_023888 [Acer saccharum]|uniref:Uncharacterized protein n=1 Tax=Acer saccharum TaxID=4024 RepID=A0AA39RIZ1_ACESA|nr:hypothetical protein LWI29_023888 [Acer saccharum]
MVVDQFAGDHEAPNLRTSSTGRRPSPAVVRAVAHRRSWFVQSLVREAVKGDRWFVSPMVRGGLASSTTTSGVDDDVRRWRRHREERREATIGRE